LKSVTKSPTFQNSVPRNATSSRRRFTSRHTLTCSRITWQIKNHVDSYVVAPKHSRARRRPSSSRPPPRTCASVTLFSMKQSSSMSLAVSASPPIASARGRQSLEQPVAPVHAPCTCPAAELTAAWALRGRPAGVVVVEGGEDDAPLNLVGGAGGEG
jgi:hypothetical protein